MAINDNVKEFTDWIKAQHDDFFGDDCWNASARVGAVVSRNHIEAVYLGCYIFESTGAYWGHHLIAAAVIGCEWVVADPTYGQFDGTYAAGVVETWGSWLSLFTNQVVAPGGGLLVVRYGTHNTGDTSRCDYATRRANVSGTIVLDMAPAGGPPQPEWF